MAMPREELLALLNCEGALVNLQKLLKTETMPPTGDDVNNHIHTTYSFSPYSPTAAVYFARKAGLCTCGLMDHDSIAGAEEFLQAAALAGMALMARCRAFSIIGVSVMGALLHNAAQYVVAAAIVRTAGLLSYLPVLLIAGTLTGIVVGVVAHVLVARLEGIVMRKSP